MREHIYKTSADCENCIDPNCWVCEARLCVCKVCGLYEGSLTTECPGVRSYAEHADDVYTGKKDFRNGAWVKMISPHCPKGKTH